MSTPATRELNLEVCSVASPELGTPGLSVPAGPILMEDQDVRGRSMEMATPVPYRGRVGRVSRSFDCQLEVVPVDLDLT